MGTINNAGTRNLAASDFARFFFHIGTKGVASPFPIAPLIGK
jgi:hypothetical protein